MWQACALVFISSACVLVIELIAGRIMAPYVGVSLYTWTSIIGIVLAGMSVGNYLGGVVADRHASRHTLGVIFVAGSVSCLFILVITDLVIGQTFRLSLLPRIVVYTTAIFLLPSLVLGMVSPLVVKLALADLQRTGNTSARSTPSPPRGRSSARSSPGSGSSPGWALAASSGLSLACCC